ncbi:MAG TPA: SusC/RagA family protein [Porphyromonadaceae bacterium]|nr:SusC/RagA family protein [Porphyromonadaceae bacterium]
MKKKISKFLTTACLLLLGITHSGLQAWAMSDYASPTQEKQSITCIVTDEFGAVTGANVIIKGTTIGNITDTDGKVILHNVASDATLVISFVGYTTLEVPVNNQKTITVLLREDTQTLSEIVVVGYGTQKKINLTGAVEQVGEEVFDNRSVSNVAQALEGAVSNLNITLEDGKPDRSASFNVRGTTSIGQGGSALVLIDGVEGDPSLLNPNDIANVSVLKDAASAAIYGARGSFGVVLITTKSPEKGKTSVNYTGNFSMRSPTVSPDNITDGVTWAEHFRESFYNFNRVLPAKINAQQEYSDEWLEKFRQRKAQGIKDEVVIEDNGTYTYYGNTDWYDLLYKDQSFAQDHNVTIQGGNEKGDFYISGRYYGANGLYNYNPDTYDSYNLRAKGSLQVFDWLKINNNMEFSNSDYHQPYVSSYSINIQRYIEVTGFPTIPVSNPDGTNTYSAAYSIGAFKDGNNYQNTNKKLFKNTAGFSTNFFNNKLRINGDLTLRYGTSLRDRKRVPVTYSAAVGSTSSINTTYNNATEINSNTFYTATNLYAEFEDTFNDAHYVKGMAGYNYETQNFRDLNIDRNGLLLEDAESINLALGESVITSANARKWRIAGMFFRLNYGYKDRYLLEFNGRYDGSSKFPADEQYAFFPSVSAGWRLSEESFWKVNRNIISDIKIRGSYGSLGNGNVDPYSFLELLSIYTSAKVLNGAKNKYTNAPAVIPNSLTWETATTTDIGLDFGLLRGKFRFSGDYYIRKTTDMYTVGVTLPEVFGASSPKGNYADMTTKGWEVTVSYMDKFQLAGKPFNYQIKASLFDYKSTIDKFNNQTKNLNDYYEGQTVGEIWGYKTDGLFQSESELEGYINTVMKSSTDNVWRVGDVKFTDIDGNGKIDYGDNTVENPGDQTIIGNSEPRYQYSFTLGGDWNGIFLSAFFQGVGRQNWYPRAEATFWGQYNRPYNSMPSWHLNNFWTEDNPDAYLPRYATYNETCGWGTKPNDRYLQNVAYLRLKNLQIGYSLPQSWISKIKMQHVRIYLTGENLWSWSPLYKHTKKTVDVYSAVRGKDTDLNSNSSATNGDGNAYPLLKTISLGLSVTF